ncbi:30S ribosomal protein S4 [Candidatus Falkowbacteria bacterium]|nr:30S ribosomal protein S4 [Candidatus Falkowbacteria bacterium]
MGRNLDPQCKQCRREGLRLFLKGDRCNTQKCAMVKRNFAPGVHGPKQGSGGASLTGYGVQLRAKQKAKRVYNILEAQFAKYYEKAVSKRGNSEDELFRLLECRLDNVIYRLGLGSSRRQARQLVNHGHFQVNGKKVTIPSFQVKINDVISIKEKSKKSPILQQLLETRQNKEPVDWLDFDAKEETGKVTGMPSLEKQKPAFDIKAIIEFYSR